MAKRFGEFTLLEDLGASETGERFRAMHDTLGGPFFVKRFSGLDRAYFGDLSQRCEALMSAKHPSLAPHLGHGEIDGQPFAVSPWLEGIDLITFRESMVDRRVTLGYDVMIYILRAVAEAVATLHAAAPFLSHGDVTARHIRVGPEGEVWLTGLPTPRGLNPGQPAAAIWDGAGVAATVYDLIGLTRPGQARPSLPTVLDRLVRRGLGIGRADDRLGPRGLVEGLDEVAEALKVTPSQESLRDLSARTLRAVGRSSSRRASGADDLPTLEPIGTGGGRSGRSSSSAAPAAIDLEPLGSREGASVEARTERVAAPVPSASSSQESGAEQEALALDWEDAGPPLQEMPPPIASLPDRARPSGRVTAPKIQRPPVAPPIDDYNVPEGTIDGPPTQPLRRSSLPIDTEELTPVGHQAPEAKAEVPREITALIMNPLVEAPDDSAEASGFSDGERTTPELQVPPTGDDPTPLPDPRTGLSDLPPDISLETETAEIDRPQAEEPPPISNEMGGLGTLMTDGSGYGPFLADPAALDEPTREADTRHSVTASGDGPLFSDDTDQPTTPLSSHAAVSTGVTPAASEQPAVDALLRSGHVTEAQVASALAEQGARGGRLIEILVSNEVLNDARVADVLAEDAVKPRISDAGLMRFLPGRELLKRLPQTFAIGRRLLPLAERETGELVMAVSDPYSEPSIEEVRQIYGAPAVEVHVATIGALKRAIAEAYRPAAGAHAEEEFTVLLCLDDDDDLVNKLGARFVEEGLAIEHAANLFVARSVLERHLPDAVVCAVDLAGADGCELLLSARADDRLVDTPFFMIGPENEDLESRVLDLGGDDFFDLPLNVNVVVKKLRRALAKRPPGEPPAPMIPPAIDFEGPTVRNTALPPGPSPLDNADLPFQFDDLGEDSDDFDFSDGGAAVPVDPDDDFAEPTGVMGTLRQMAVSEIVQSLELGRKTARVELVPTDGLKGSFSFRDGQVVYATCEDLDGELAFFELAKAKEGFFRIHYGDEPTEQNIDKPTTFLLLEAMRRIDEEAA